MSNNNGIAVIKRMTFNCLQIENMQIDFLNNKCSFTCQEAPGEETALLMQFILRGFFIQYHEHSIAFFTYKKKKK
ncbi:hypothetical protein [Paenisporosarcina sp. TG20]|uniref:hypothetical protein n=1 Tax=Paenisporosarcina sp. TG20 TaxID=1211706 RepID=UPI000305102C|nr:hypothetical protein [Paenisporosarcina sp. TG20]